MLFCDSVLEVAFDVASRVAVAGGLVRRSPLGLNWVLHLQPFCGEVVAVRSPLRQHCCPILLR